MFKKQYQILWALNVEKLAQNVYSEMNNFGWLPLGGAVFADDSSGSTPRGWYQTMWLPEDSRKEEELLVEDNIGIPPVGSFEND